MIELAPLGCSPLGMAAFALGARHAIDADHLTVIDGIARRNLLARPALASAGGALFSLGHVLVVVGIAVATALIGPATSTAPAWLAPTGLVTSATIMFGLGLLNVRAAWMAPSGAHVRPIGWRARLALGGNHPFAIVATGGLFAISFDTVAIALGFGMAGSLFGGVAAAFLAAACFAAGMILVGGANGVGIVQLLRSAGRHAATASRVMTALIGLLNIALALLTIAALLAAPVETWRSTYGFALSAIVIGACALGFLLVRKRPASTTTKAIEGRKRFAGV